jgi:hypothetical protein
LLVQRKIKESDLIVGRELCIRLVNEKKRMVDRLCELNAMWAKATEGSLNCKLTQKEIGECRLTKGMPDEMKVECVTQAIQKAWNEVCLGASKYVNSNQVVKVYLSFLLNLMLSIFDKFCFESRGKRVSCERRLEEMVWIWFNW